MIPSAAMGLSPLTLREYKGVLRVAIKPNGKLDKELIWGWSRSRRVVLRAALKNMGCGCTVKEKCEFHVQLANEPRAHRRKDLDLPTETELQRLEEAIAALPDAPRILLQLVLLMGFRSQEVLGLTRKSIERALDVGQLTFLRKGNYTARLPTRHVGHLFTQLLETPSARGHKWTLAGETLSWGGVAHTQYKQLRRWCRKAGRVSGVKNIRPHLLRHAFATRLVRQGAPLPVVQRWLGHAKLATTMRYLHADMGDVEKWAPKPSATR